MERNEGGAGEVGEREKVLVYKGEIIARYSPRERRTGLLPAETWDFWVLNRNGSNTNDLVEERKIFPSLFGYCGRREENRRQK
jgi:hypothetical protein